MTKLTKDAKALQNKIRAFLKSLGVDARPKRIKLTVDFLCDFVNTEHNKAVEEVESEVFEDKILSEDVIPEKLSIDEIHSRGYKSRSEMKRVELMKSAKTSKIIIP